MRKIIFTKTLEEKYVLNELKKNYKLDEEYLVIVPDRITLTYQAKVLKSIGRRCAMNITVASFSRLSELVLQTNAKSTFNQQAETMIMRKILEDNKQNLLHYRKSADKINFPNEVIDLINCMRNNKAMEAFDAMYKKFLSDDQYKRYLNKVSDIMLLYKEYKKYIDNHKLDTITKLEKLAQNFKDSKYKKFNIYIADFLTFTKVELDIIEQFIDHANSVCIGLVKPSILVKNERIYPQEFNNAIISYMQKYNDYQISEADKEDEDLDDTLKALRNNLFSYSFGDNSLKHNNCVDIYAAADPRSEIVQVAKQIKALIKREGLRYKDIAVACSDTNTYNNIIDDVFKKYEIPAYLDKKSRLINQNLIKILLCGLRIVNDGYKQIDVLDFVNELKSYFIEEDVFYFEDYCLKYGIKYKKGFKKEFEISNFKGLENAQKVQKKFIEAIEVLEENKSKDILDHVKVINNFLEKINAEKLMNDLAIVQEEILDLESATITKQVVKKISETLSLMKEIFKDNEISFRHFSKILESTFVSQQISTRPTYIDCVYVGDTDKSRYDNKQYLFVVGANQDVFPKETKDFGLLSLDELAFWADQEVVIYPNVEQINKNAKLSLLMTLLRPTKRLIISYSTSSQGGGKLFRSNVIDEIENIICVKSVTLPKIDNNSTEADVKNHLASRWTALEDYVDLCDRINKKEIYEDERIASIKKALYKTAESIYDKKNMDKIINRDYTLSNNVNYGDAEVFKNNKTGITKIESYFNCPFKFFAGYMLKLKERELSKVNSLDKGIMVHKILEKFFKNKHDEEDVTTYFSIVSKYYNEIKEDEKYNFLKQEEYNTFNDFIVTFVSNFLIKLVAKSKNNLFKPSYFEEPFKDGGKLLKPIEIQCGDKVIKIDGVIDRIDLYENKFIVIDYKTSSAINFNDKIFEKGQRLQLYLYMDAVMKSTNLVPAGAYYLPIQSNLKADPKYVGYTNLDQDIVKYIANGVENKSSSELYPIKKDKNGVIKQTAKNELKNHITQINKLEEMIKCAINEMESGYVAPSPSEANNCEMCAFKYLCDGDVKANLIRGK